MEYGIHKMKQLYKDTVKIAYFSMEIGFHEEIPTYSGGLGILAGDTLRSCADLEVPILGVTLISNKGYFIQKFDDKGMQIEEPCEWEISRFMQEVKQRVTVRINGEEVIVRAWRYDLRGIGGHLVPIYFMDTDLEENSPEMRKITHRLYGGDRRYRLSQELILGIGGYRILKQLGYYDIAKYHMNEGHSALLTLELRKDLTDDGTWDIFDEKVEKKVHNRCVFTTHTPVPAGHDKFAIDLVKELLGDYLTEAEYKKMCPGEGLNMTLLALNSSKYINGVAKKHGEISREMFPGFRIDSITNGIHTAFWSSEPMKRLFDKYLVEWKKDPFTLRNAFNIPLEEIWAAHHEAKGELVSGINKKYGLSFDREKFTIGFARRITAYKRPYMFFSDKDRIRKIVEFSGGLQVIFAGKAHPKDHEGKKIIIEIKKAMAELSDKMNVVYLENYNMALAKKLVAGVDLWLNNPQPPKEASGTSGMKAGVNGVPNLSILDGWWLEGHVENVTGWSINERPSIGKPAAENSRAKELENLYDKLENVILPTYYDNREGWMRIMQNSIGFNGSFFNTHRMVYQYVLSAYFD